MLYKEEAYKIIGACIEVHKELGCGFLEAVYQEALCVEFERQGLPFLREQQLRITYKGLVLSKYYIADFICYDKIILELKALTELTSQHISQTLNYLKATELKLALLINFGEQSLKYKRVINEHSKFNLRINTNL